MRKGLVPTTAQALDGHLGWGGLGEAVPISGGKCPGGYMSGGYMSGGVMS